MSQPRDDRQKDLFRPALDRIINMGHPLVRLGQQIVVLSRRPGRVRAVLRIDRPLAGRQAGDPDLVRVEAELWRMIRDDAAAAERETIDVAR